MTLDMDVYDLAEWCALAELGAISMDNGCAAVAFPDFTRGHWNEVKGYHHAFAAPTDEAQAELDAATATMLLKVQGMKEWMGGLKKSHTVPTADALKAKKDAVAAQVALLTQKAGETPAKAQADALKQAAKILKKADSLKTQQ